jgi:hypothetical protein
MAGKHVLTPSQIRNHKCPLGHRRDILADGNRLQHVALPTGKHNWYHPYTRPDGRETIMSFGPVDAETARQLNDEAIALEAQGLDPQKVFNERKEAAKVAAACG